MNDHVHTPATRRLLSLTGLGLILTLAGTACDDATAPDEDEEHGDPEAVRLVLDGEEIARAEPGEGSSTGEIGVEAGGRTGVITVEFLDDDGDAVEFHEDEYHLDVGVDDASVAGFEHESPGAFEGRVVGHEAGSTTMRFRLMHGGTPGTGHADFISDWIPVVVEEADGAS